jgi:hypothetical protein
MTLLTQFRGKNIPEAKYLPTLLNYTCDYLHNPPRSSILIGQTGVFMFHSLNIHVFHDVGSLRTHIDNSSPHRADVLFVG